MLEGRYTFKGTFGYGSFFGQTAPSSVIVCFINMHAANTHFSSTSNHQQPPTTSNQPQDAQHVSSHDRTPSFTATITLITLITCTHRHQSSINCPYNVINSCHCTLTLITTCQHFDYRINNLTLTRRRKIIDDEK